MRRADARFSASIMQQQLHQVMVHRMQVGCTTKISAAAHVLEDLDVNLAIGKLGELRLPQRDAENAQISCAKGSFAAPEKILNFGSGVRVGFRGSPFVSVFGVTFFSPVMIVPTSVGLRCEVAPRLVWLLCP